MPCTRPISGYYSRRLNENGKRTFVSKPQEGYQDMRVTIPCGRCIGCKLEKSRSWAIRLLHEAEMEEENCFLTLTYNDESLPEDYSLNKKHFPAFMKRLRERLNGKRISYYHCGEYGDKTRRPHYHAALFGYSPSDRRLHSIQDGNRLYTSEQLTSCWNLGHVLVGELTFHSASYITRYVTKKLSGPLAEGGYDVLDIPTGEVLSQSPEYATMSRNPAIGKRWIQEYAREVLRSDSLVINGKECKPPIYYDRYLAEHYPAQHEQNKTKRTKRFAQNPDAATTLKAIAKEALIKKKQQSKKEKL